METGQKQLLKLKLGHLEEQRIQLHKILDDHVDKVLHRGNAWIEGIEGDTYGQISQLVEDTAMLVTQKCSDISGATQVYEASPLSAAVTADSSTVTRKYAQVPVDRGVSTSTVSQLEETISSLRQTVEQMSHRQSKVEECLDGISTRQSQIAGNHEISLQERDENTKQLMSKLSEIENKRLLRIEHQLLALESSQLEVTTHLDKAVIDKAVGMEKQEQKNEWFENRLQDLEKDLGYVESSLNYDKQIEKMEEKIAKLEEDVETVEKFETLVQKVKKLEAVGKKVEQYESLGQQLKSLEELIESVGSRVDDHGESLQELMESVDVNTSALENSSTFLEKLQEVQDRIATLETGMDQKSLEQKCEDVEKKYKMVCQIVADRLAPLEKLREVFNQKIKTREENVEKLTDLLKKMSVLVPKVSQLETLSRKQPVLFTAGFNNVFSPVQDTIVQNFSLVRCNSGDWFDNKTGVFTAPADGVYGVSLSMWQTGEGKTTLWLNKLQSGYQPDNAEDDGVLLATTCRDASSDSGFAVVDMNRGDQLYLYLQEVFQQRELKNGLMFSCFLIG